MVFFDSESCGFYGPTILIQWAEDQGPIHIHNIWRSTVGSTLDLIEFMMKHQGGVCGYNLVHDAYHLQRTYGVLSLLPRSDLPTIEDYRDCEQDDASRDLYCVKPVTALDLMLYGRKNEFQSTLNQKDIIIRKVPKVLAEELVKHLKENVKIPSIYFSRSRTGYHWRIIPLHKDSGREVTPEELSKIKKGESNYEIDNDFVNIKLAFSPSTALKIIIEMITGEKADTLEEMFPLPKPEEHGWYPSFGGWTDVIREHIWAWSNDERRLKYARNDVEYLRLLYKYFGCPTAGDDDSVLACAIGAMYWHGYSFDKEAAQKRFNDCKKIVAACPINVNAPKATLKYIHEVCSPLEKQGVPNTSKETLTNLLEWKEDNPEVYKRVNLIIEARRAYKELDLLEKLLIAGRFYCVYKVIGTKSNRMSGGSESYLKRGGSINPQGIKKGDIIRSIITLGSDNMPLCGGDFDAFEISIAEAVYNDPGLREVLLSGKKLHALFAEEMYQIPYDEIMEFKDCNENDPKGWYSRGKKAVFALLYGAEIAKLSSVLLLEEEEVYEGMQRFYKRFKGVKEAQNRIYENHMALRQPDGIGTQVVWQEPKEYCESFLGFRRYFSLEYNVIRTLFNLASNIPDEMKKLGSQLKVVRCDRLQTGSGAVCSALYAAAFNQQQKVMRASANHEIQSPGGQITKVVQRKIWDVQPAGCTPWLVMPMNIHDELESPCKQEVVDEVAIIVNNTIESFKDRVPLLSMKWKTGLKNWGEK